MIQGKHIATTINEYLNESSIELFNQEINHSIESLGIEGRFLNKEQAIDLQKEIESNYMTDGMRFGKENTDIRTNLFNYDNPIAEKTINDINLKIVSGLLRDNKKTYLLYVGGEIVGEFYSVVDIKKLINYMETNLVKEIPNKKFIK